MEDSGAEVERRPLVPKVPVSNPVMSGFYLWDFPHKRREYQLSLQEADSKGDKYKLKVCFAFDVKLKKFKLKITNNKQFLLLQQCFQLNLRLFLSLIKSSNIFN